MVKLYTNNILFFSNQAVIFTSNLPNIENIGYKFSKIIFLLQVIKGKTYQSLIFHRNYNKESLIMVN
jgi:hypothetical protein